MDKAQVIATITAKRGANCAKLRYERSTLRFGPLVMTAPRLILSITLIASLGVVSACGRRGDPERPADVRYEQEREAARKARQPAPPKPSRETPDRRFILDGLID